MSDEKVMIILFYIVIPLFALFTSFFPFIAIVVLLGIILLFLLWYLSKDSYVKVSDVKKSISTRLDISTSEIFFDLNKKNATYLRPGNYRVFTSKGEFILELGIEYNNFYSIELSQVSDVNFIDELNI
ncbi:hypothetical protein [Bacillus cereus group sp. BfR-BA-01382]|uniref:hypothetical protein n=1 Tax=Bacillus cereus group sp. BfR-BA-01382 TaxID=2920326 RepID=UPI001F587A52